MGVHEPYHLVAQLGHCCPLSALRAGCLHLCIFQPGGEPKRVQRCQFSCLKHPIACALIRCTCLSHWQAWLEKIPHGLGLGKLLVSQVVETENRNCRGPKAALNSPIWRAWTGTAVRIRCRAFQAASPTAEQFPHSLTPAGHTVASAGKSIGP